MRLRTRLACVRRSFPVVAIALAVSACNPHVRAFSAVPRHICAGERVDIAWSVVGSARVEVQPPVDALPNGPVSDEGQATIVPKTTTRVDLHVTRPLGNPTTRTQEIEVLAGTSKREVLAASLGDPAASPGCNEGKVWATVRAKRFSNDVKVATVSSHQRDDRTYEVEHAGIRASLSPGVVLTSFEGTTLAGDWALTAPLANGQTCATAPRVLVIDVVTQCMPEARQ